MYIKLLIFSNIARLLSSSPARIICRDPDLGGQATPEQINDRKFMLVGCEECTGAGFGNQMIFFSSAYYFAALTGRDLVIFDNSVIGEFCKMITCGFPMVSQMSLAYPEVLGENHIKSMKSAKVFDFRKHMEGKESLDKYFIIYIIINIFIKNVL